jgi:hypothetical protein
MEEIMYARCGLYVNINDEPKPKHHEHVDEYQAKRDAHEVLRALLVRAATEFANTARTTQIDELIKTVWVNIDKESEPTWQEIVENEANDIIRRHTDLIIEYAIDNDEIDNDINSYQPMIRNVRESEVGWLQPDEAIELLEELYEHEETDSGKYENDDYRDMLAAKSAFTYRNALYAEINDQLERIAYEVEDIIEEVDDEISNKELSEDDREMAIKTWIKEMIDDETAN